MTKEQIPRLPKTSLLRSYGSPYAEGYTSEQMSAYGQACFEEGQKQQPSYGWLEAADEEMVCTHLGVAELSDRYEVAKAKLQSLIEWHVAVANDPRVNGAAAMTEVADRFAHRLALELECVLADRPRYYDKAMQVLSEYRAAMNAIHEQQCPTFMGEPALGGIEEGRNSNPTLESMIVKEALTGMVDAQIQAHFGRPTGGIEP